MTDLELARYLERIHYTGALTPTKETLFDLQLAHLLAVPFENLSIGCLTKLSRDDAAAFVMS